MLKAYGCSQAELVTPSTRAIPDPSTEGLTGVVGESTGGGAHPTRGERIDDRFVLNVPFARAINPITKTNWEGIGVEPDVKVAPSEALTVAQGRALQEINRTSVGAGTVTR